MEKNKKTKAQQGIDADQEKLYKEALSKEMMKRITDKISEGDENVMKTFKSLLETDDNEKMIRSLYKK